MATTALEIITEALTEIGVYSVGEGISAADSQTALKRLRFQLDAWDADRLTINVTNRVTSTIVSGDNTMTIGDGGDIDTTRPVWIDQINYLIPGSSPSVEVPMAQMNDGAYQTLSIKSQSSSLPTQWYYNPTYPLGTLFFWPTVSQNVSIALYLPQPERDAMTLTLASTLTGPPGYREGFMYQLALRLCGPFGKPIPPALPEMASQAYARLKRPNTEPPLLGVDAALVPTTGGGYNILSDTQTGYTR